MKKIFLFLFFSCSINLSWADCNLQSFIATIPDVDLSIRGVVIEEIDVSHDFYASYSSKIKVKILQKYYGIETQDTIEVTLKGYFNNIFFKFKEKKHLFNLDVKENSYVIHSSICPCNTYSLVIKNDSINEFGNSFFYKDYEQKIMNTYGLFHNSVNEIRYGDSQYMNLKKIGHEKWKFTLKDTLYKNGIYRIYDIYNGMIYTKEYYVYLKNELQKSKTYYHNHQKKSLKQYQNNQLIYSSEYYENGQRKEHQNFHNGQLQYSYSYWLNGIKKKYIVIKENHTYSIIEKTSNGKIKRNGILKNEHYIGITSNYNKQNELIEQSFQDENGIQGTHWFIEGNSIWFEIYENDILNGNCFMYLLPNKYVLNKCFKWEKGEIKIFLKENRQLITGIYLDGEKHKTWTKYFYHKKKKQWDSTIIYKNGKIISQHFFSEF